MVDPRIGKNFGGYEILSRLGEGGRSVVYLAYQNSMKRNVAMKILLQLPRRTEERFNQEMLAIANLQHPHIIPIYDYGVTDDGFPYLIMRYLDGGTLADLLRSAVPLSLTRINTIMTQVGSALDFAHENGFIHRHIKPSNILLDTNGNAYIADFELSLFDEEAGNLTATGAYLGTPTYISPEQVIRSQVDKRSDIYSLGVVLYETLAGQPPFVSDSVFSVMNSHINETPSPVSKFRPEIPQAISQVIDKTLAKDPEKRYQTAAELVEAYHNAFSVKEVPDVSTFTALPTLSVQSKQPLMGNPEADEVFFSAYYPRTARVNTRYSIYLYAHINEVKQLMEQDIQRFAAELGGSVPPGRSAKNMARLAQGTPITIAIDCDDIEFEPTTLTKKWDDTWVRFNFDFKARPELDGQTVTGRIGISVFSVEIANIKFAFDVEAVASSSGHVEELNPLAEAKLLDSKTAKHYQNIFISYSRQDRLVAENYRYAQMAMGNDVFMDSYSIRAGEDWRAALARAIDRADVFQLFWSEHAAQSPNVKDEWEYALTHKCPETKCADFVRPVYWTQPLPVPPPEPLSHLNFRYVPMVLTSKDDGEITIRRGLPRNADAIAALLARTTSPDVSEMDIKMSFAKNDYVLAATDNNVYGLVKYQVEGGVTLVESFIFAPELLSNQFEAKLIDRVEQASRQLHSEICFVAIAPNTPSSIERMLIERGYTAVKIDEITNNHWRDVVAKITNARNSLFSKRLRTLG